MKPLFFVYFILQLCISNANFVPPTIGISRLSLTRKSALNEYFLKVNMFYRADNGDIRPVFQECVLFGTKMLTCVHTEAFNIRGRDLILSETILGRHSSRRLTISHTNSNSLLSLRSPAPDTNTKRIKQYTHFFRFNK